MARVTVEDCVDKIPNRFDLVLCQHTALASFRAAPILWSIGTGTRTLSSRSREIANKSLKPDELKEEFIKSLQRHAEVDEPEGAQPAEEVGKR